MGHLCRRYLHLPWHVLWSLRHPEAHHRGQGRQPHGLLPPRMGCDRHRRTHFLPHYTIRRRMMMTSGGGVKYKGSFDCARQIMANEGFMSMMKGAGANVLRGVAGAGVLAGFDKFQSLYIQWRTGA